MASKLNGPQWRTANHIAARDFIRDNEPKEYQSMLKAYQEAKGTA